MARTVGSYVHNDTFVHKLDPRVKLFTVILYIVIVFLAKHLMELSIVLVIPILSLLLSKIRFTKIFSMMKPVIFIGIFLFVINTLTIHESTANHVYYKWTKFIISKESITRTILIMSRIYMTIMITTVFTTSTKPTAMTKAIEDLLLPLKLIKVPVNIIAMIISIALRFIPTLLGESQRIMKAQASRGVDFKNGGIKSKAKSITTLIIPIFVVAFTKADDLAHAMETRGYDPYAKRTRYLKYQITMKDVFASFLIIGLCCYIALSTFTDFIPYPTWWSQW